jgi:16S rRNA (cytosine1402-N4)-methyltransferase
MDFHHISVLRDACIEGLALRPDGIYVDGTLGGGGHAEAILEQLTTGKLIGIDQDADALAAATKRLERFGDRFIPYRSNFADLEHVLVDLGIDAIDGILLDLGVSSYQLDEADRGFSYMADGELDMRMDRRQALTAADVVNTYSEEALTEIITSYGEERWAKRIAEFICQERPIETTEELVAVIKKAVPKGARRDGPHPAKRTFQAIRIEVNDELGVITRAIDAAVARMRPGGRIAIITFHSLEDRIVKNHFKELAKGCVCPPEFPVCVCDKEREVKIITRKPILPTEEELEQNPRARSAKLRVAERR